MNSNRPKIYGIGNPLIDVVISAKDDDINALGLDKGVMHLVDEDRQKEILDYFKDSSVIYHPGGSAPNTLLACAGLGVSALIAGKIGKDHFGDVYTQQAKEFGVISGLVKGNGSTGSSIILVTPDGERTMNTHLGMCREFSEDDIDGNQLAYAKFFYFTGYMWDTESQKSAIISAISIAKKNDIKIVFDVADPFAVNRNKDEFLTMIQNDVDLVFANQSELAILFETDDYKKSADLLGEIVQMAGIKLGKKGSLVINNGEQSISPPRPITAVDSTGAGDMYAAGFLTALSNGCDSFRAGEIGGYLAEEIIQGPGAQFEINKMKEFKTTLF
ncbi:MAG: adenosine kinase [Candidatus Marinimicrobia bacterium]|jgi:sugar/nucleoside kinase (ribokinase family)|nr:adenosine kinase [Candidatus Neomarinimicrobiota bacterium]MBT3675489.1 adenosine kinase [Candidatus Neomarinimicrobiota bacterium]MBT3762799.1 adenosine kinase [Candidatus Neomarinimicrobiota bacterium]MBT4069279.1 adenosine kinase [Candidatus Neomarinimicrobiota bacterium]MBT4270420.1 adenosine kinase [Candidatus Neomarinimicrobiota bacterium]